mgnify:CR=1 FL=1
MSLSPHSHRRPSLTARVRDLRLRLVNIYRGKPSRPRKKIGATQISPDADAHALLSRIASHGAPSLVARLGSTENAVVRYYVENQEKGQCIFPENLKTAIRELSGFFPATDDFLVRFSQESLQHLGEVDVLAVRSQVSERTFWDLETFFVTRFCPSSKLIDLNLLVPLGHPSPWTSSLAGKKVLIIHPFEESIRQQYNKRAQLFPGSDVLPEFRLDVLPAVQSIGDNVDNVSFETWFEALDHMKAEIARRDFDVALIGAGAYGLFLAAECKRLGKVGIHIGGATQLLFGIKGKRWTDPESPDSREVLPLINQHWASPLPSEIPLGANKVEDGCYWS